MWDSPCGNLLQSKVTPAHAVEESLDIDSDRDSDEAYLETTRDEANRSFNHNVTRENRRYECMLAELAGLRFWHKIAGYCVFSVQIWITQQMSNSMRVCLHPL